MTEEGVKKCPAVDYIGKFFFIPYNDTDKLLDLNNELTATGESSFTCSHNKQKYSHPDYISTNENPVDQKPINEINTYSSYKEVQSAFSISAKVEGSYGAMSGSVSTDFLQEQTDIDKLYTCVNATFIPYFTAKLNMQKIGDENLEKMRSSISKFIPEKNIDTTSKESVKSYEQFFKKYGSHFASKITVGGGSYMTTKVQQTESITKEHLQVTISAAYAGMASGSVTITDDLLEIEKTENFHFAVYAEGGEKEELASINKLNSDNSQRFQKWLDSIAERPDLISAEYTGIWTLFEKEVAEKLETAYSELYKRENYLTDEYPNFGTEIKDSKLKSINVKNGKQESSTCLTTPIWKNTSNDVASIFKRTANTFEIYSGSYNKEYKINWLSIYGNSPYHIRNEKQAYIDRGTISKVEKATIVPFTKEFASPPQVFLTGHYKKDMEVPTIRSISTDKFEINDGNTSKTLLYNWVAIGKLKNPEEQNTEIHFGRIKHTTKTSTVDISEITFKDSPIIIATIENTDGTCKYPARVETVSEDQITLASTSHGENCWINWIAINFLDN